MAAKTIQEQIAEMENRCAKLEELQKLFEKAVKNEFGIEAKNFLSIFCTENSLNYYNKKRAENSSSDAE